MSFNFGGTTPAQPAFGTTPAKPGFGSGFAFGGTPATTTTTGFGTSFGSTFGAPASSAAATPAFGTSFGAAAASTATTGFGTFAVPASSAAPAFGTSFGTPATSGATGFGTSFGAPSTSAPAFGTSFGAPATSGFGTTFGTPASSAAPTFGGFSGFGGTAATTASNLFSGFGTSTTTTPSGFTGFGAAAPGFGGAGTGLGTGTAFGGTGTALGTGLGTSTGSAFGGTGTFGGFGTGGSTFGGFGSTFSKPAATAAPAFGQQIPLQQPTDPNQAIYSSIFNCCVFNDERDTVLAKWNLIQASWGCGKGYWSPSQPPVQYTLHNPYCRFKAVGYSVIQGGDNKDGIVAVTLNKKDSEVRPQKDQFLATLTTIMGNKPNLTVSIIEIRPISDMKTQLLICVQEKGMTGSVRKIPASDLATYLLQPMQKQQLSGIGVDNVFAHIVPDSDQLKEYLAKPPCGIDIRIWKQAQLDNPNPEKYIPVPLIGFEQLKWRSKCQEKETSLHRGFMEKVSVDLIELKCRHAASIAQIAQQKRKLLNLQHRVLQILVKQEVTRKSGMALQPEEEVLKGQLENMQTQISVPTQFKGRLNELLAQIRMQVTHGYIAAPERYTMEATVQEDIKQFLRMEQNGINHLVEIINTDLSHLKTIRDGMHELTQKQS